MIKKYKKTLIISSLTLLIPVIVGLLVLRLLLMPMKIIWKLALNSLSGFVCLWLLNLASGITGIVFEINFITTLLVGFLGVPGIILEHSFHTNNRSAKWLQDPVNLRKLAVAEAAVLAAAFRQSYLRRGVGSALICVGGAMVLYELSLFAAGLFQGLTYGGRWGVFVMTGLVSPLAAGILYKPLKYIGTIGGNLWKE